jgi:Kef-type K+ transport system membrane component KefB
MTSSATAATAIMLLDLAVIVTAGSLLATLASRCGQPSVIGEIVAGILLGPTLLGMLPGHLTERLFPLQDRVYLSTLANLGLVMFMFTVGFELDHRQLRRLRSAVAVVSVTSVALPFILGSGLALLLYPASHMVDGHRVGMLPFVLFFGVATSITAFPVLARILTGLKEHRSPLGTFATACAAGADLMAWTVLAVVVAVATGGRLLHTLALLGQVALLVLLLIAGVRPLLRRILQRGRSGSGQGKLPLLLIVVGLMLSAWVTTRLGFQPVFGGFIFGAALPRDVVLAAAPEVLLLIEQASQLLVPVFFVTTGLSVSLSGLGVGGYADALMLIVVACIGKFVGATTSALACGFDRRQASALGVLMNSRGLTELVVIQVGMALGILGERLAAAMIIMALVTTIATTPVFRLVQGYRASRDGETNARRGGLAAASAPSAPVPGAAEDHAAERP